jgi:hypothetical protein
MTPRRRIGRVSTAVNTLTLGGAFLIQAAIGWILHLWPRTASDGWDPDRYSWALALTAALQALAALVMATAQRRGHAVQCDAPSVNVALPSHAHRPTVQLTEFSPLRGRNARGTKLG